MIVNDTENKINAKVKDFLLIFGIFLFSFLIFISNPSSHESLDVVPNRLLPISIIQDQVLTFDKFVDLSQPLPYCFFKINNRIVSGSPIVPGLLLLPIYFIAFLLKWNLFYSSYSLARLGVAIISALSAVFIYLILKRFCQKKLTPIFLTFIYVIATCVWSIASQAIWQHGPSLFFITIGLWMIVRENKSLIPYAGFFLGMAVWNRPANIVIALPLAIYVFKTYRQYIWRYLLLGAIPILLMCLYSYYYIGTIWVFGQARNSMADLSGDMLKGIFGLLLSPSRGLIILSPIFLFSFIYLFKILCSKKTELILKYLAISIILLILIFSKWSAWYAGQCFGYRYLTEAIPFLIIFLALCWENYIIKYNYLKIIFIVFLILSIYVQYLGTFVWPTDPNLTDLHPEYLWNWATADITLCTQKLFHFIP